MSASFALLLLAGLLALTAFFALTFWAARTFGTGLVLRVLVAGAFIGPMVGLTAVRIYRHPSAVGLPAHLSPTEAAVRDTLSAPHLVAGRVTVLPLLLGIVLAATAVGWGLSVTVARGKPSQALLGAAVAAVPLLLGTVWVRSAGPPRLAVAYLVPPQPAADAMREYETAMPFAAEEPVPAGPMPEWVKADGADTDSVHPVVHGGQFADGGASRRDAAGKAEPLVRDAYRRAIGHDPGRVAPPEVETYFLGQTYQEPIRRTAGENEFTVYRTHLRLNLGPDALDRLASDRRATARTQHTRGVIYTFAALTGLAGVVAVALRGKGKGEGRG